MRSSSSGMPIRFLAGAFLIALAQGLLAPEAAAGCNHAVGSGTHDRFLASVARFDDLITGGTLADSQDMAPRKPAPCSGPGCSGHVPPLSGSTTVIAPPTLDHWGVLQSQARSSSASHRSEFSEAAWPLPAILSSGIFHPPRFLA
ncbi:hypothetical protein [Aquisphaera insulae]|uniref:hypothetical protein n=1 Tax=Aquisphaera insulae TaxID=2712864 RepID=UPI0013EADFE6|nr:hypothetical protein [Aquisphaera insulae]